MSYCFGMFFKQVKKEEVIDIMNQCAKYLIENSYEYIKKSVYYIPSVRNRGDEITNEYWLDTLFSLNFVYWDDINLLGLSGYEYPCEIRKMFTTHVTFQNSTDQDYEYDDWNDKIDVFKECKQYVEKLSDSDIAGLFNEDSLADDDIAGLFNEDSLADDDLDYYRKTCLYNKIYEKLSLEDWLYDNYSDSFKRFKINAIDSSEKKFNINTKLKKFLQTLDMEE